MAGIRKAKLPVPAESQEQRALVLPVPPASNRYWRIWRGRAVKSPEARAYRAAVVLAWARWNPGKARKQTGRVSVRVDWYRAAKRGDLDNRLKVALDALQGLAYTNDSQIVRIVANRYEAPENPRLEVTVSAAR